MPEPSSADAPPSLLHDLDSLVDALYRASTLGERMRWLEDDLPDAAVDEEMARTWMEQWDEAFDERNVSLADRMDAQDLRRDDLRRLLGAPASVLREWAPERPAWIAYALDALRSTTDEREAAVVECFSAAPRDDVQFVRFALPVVGHGFARLTRHLHSMADREPAVVDAGAVAPDFLRGLFARLTRQVTRTMALELNVARLSGDLSGDDPQERYRSFLRRLHRPDVRRSLYEEYPVLLRLVTTMVMNWETACREIVDRLHADRDAIEDRLVDGALGPLTGVELGAGDAHRKGRMVAELAFESGRQVVYKPRSLDVDVQMHRFVDWVNARSSTDLRLPGVLARDGYGWMQHVSPEPARGETEVRRFYERQGRFLALAYLLGTVDLHRENLIAAGEHPVYVDFETVMHPDLQRDGPWNVLWYLKDLRRHTVLDAQLLPRQAPRSRDADDEGPPDESGLGGARGQRRAGQFAVLRDLESDRAHVEREVMLTSGGDNRPVVDGEPVNAADYAAEVRRGFRETYRLLERNRDTLAAPDGPLAGFQDVEVRVIPRASSWYGRLLSEGVHPDLLRDGRDRDLHAEHVWSIQNLRPFTCPLIPAELDDLHRGDIPTFYTRPDSTDLLTSTGERLPDQIPEPAFQDVQRRLDALGDDDLRRQDWLIEQSLHLIDDDRTERVPEMAAQTDTQSDLDAGRVRGAARSIGDRLASLALHGHRDASWYGLQPAPSLSLDPLDFDLYDGLGGTVLFLAHLGHETGESRYTELAAEGLETLGRFARHDDETPSVGAFAGWGSLAYVVAHLHRLWPDADVAGAHGEAVLHRLDEQISADQSPDLIDGLAGAVAALLRYDAAVGSPRALQLARRAGSDLLDHAQPVDLSGKGLNGAAGEVAGGGEALGWPTRDDESDLADRPQVGFAHGSAGITWALLQLAECTGETDFRTAARRGIAYERAAFDPDEENWPFFHSHADADRHGASGSSPETDSRPAASFQTAWCHGAPGVGLARLDAWETLAGLDDTAQERDQVRDQMSNQVRDEVESALRTTLDRGFGRSHSLCHGDLGNAELLRAYADHFGDASVRNRARVVTARVARAVEDGDWTCGDPYGYDVLGMMIGLSGIGYGLLRALSPQTVPNVLLLHLPERTDESTDRS